jgi:hypothetical protein
MRVKLRVKELRTLQNGKGYVLAFQTQYDEELGTYFSSDTDPVKIKTKYPQGKIFVLDVLPYISKGVPGLSVVAPLSDQKFDELF